jgi:hypothetical protein
MAPTLAPSDSAALSDAIGRITAMAPVRARTSTAYPAIPANVRQQADLYARAFATQLLTVDYAQSRDDLLSWVQSESAMTAEPRVIGLVPADQRAKYGVWSLTDLDSFATPPIASAADWHAWAVKHGRSSVEIVRVTEPTKWSNAVSDGQISDPGVTARDVDANVTTTWVENGKHKTARYSVSLSLTLEGPPTRADYRFVNTVSYNTVAIGD